MPENCDESARAHYLAAMAVAANEFGIGVRQLSLADEEGLYQGAHLVPLSQWCPLEGDLGYAEHNLIEEYLTVLVAGTVGRLIWMQSRRAQLSRAYAGVSLEWTSLCEAIACREKEADKAFAIALGLLSSIDGGNPDATIYRLWQQAKRLLCQTQHRERVINLARHLQTVKRLTGDEVNTILKG